MFINTLYIYSVMDDLILLTILCPDLYSHSHINKFEGGLWLYVLVSTSKKDSSKMAGSDTTKKIDTVTKTTVKTTEEKKTSKKKE